jgi:nitrate/TMAO reductase-like tetraheme cytochrome c subunit
MLDQLRNERGWPVVAVDIGGLVKGFGPQADLKFQMTLNAMQAMKYEVIALGSPELQFSIGELLFAGVGRESPFLSANAALLAFDAGMTEASRVAEAAGMKLGITSIVGKKWQKEIHNDDVVLADPEKKLAEVIPALAEQCDVVVLLAHATREESIALAERFAQIDLLVTAGGPPEPPGELEYVAAGKTPLIEVGEKGMNAVVLGFYDDPTRPIRYQRVPLDSRFPQSSYLKKLMEQYQEGLKELGLKGLGVSAVPYPGRELMGGFVGSKECKSCHEESYKVWKKSGHAKAWETLLEKDPPRNFDPECISCHVVGWSPQNYRPFTSGFLSEEKTPHLVDVGCETCHGPGEKHVKAEMGADFDLQEKLRKAAVITLEESQQAVSRAISDMQPCMNCHDLDNSPDFDFQTYWPKIEHREE